MALPGTYVRQINSDNDNEVVIEIAETKLDGFELCRDESAVNVLYYIDCHIGNILFDASVEAP